MSVYSNGRCVTCGVVTYPTAGIPSIGMDFGATVAPNVEQITAAGV